MLKFKLATEASGAVNETLTEVLICVERVAFCSKSAVPQVTAPYVIDNVKLVAVPNLTLALNIHGCDGLVLELVNVNEEPADGKLRS